MIFGDANLAVHNIVLEESKCAGYSRLSLVVNKTKAFIVFIFNSAQQQCSDLTWKIENTGFSDFLQL
jgi:hypothetical protein